MGARKRFMFDTHLDLVYKGSVSVNEFFCKNMVLFVTSFWVSISTYLFHLFGFITRYLFRLTSSMFRQRFQDDDSSQKDESECPIPVREEENQIISNHFKTEPEPEPEVINFEDSEYDGFEEKETSKFSFKFQFQTHDVIRRISEESEVSIGPEKALETNIKKCQFLPLNNFSGFMEEPEIMSFSVKEVHVNSNEDSHDNQEILDGGFLLEKDFVQYNSETDTVREAVMNDSINGDDSEELESVILTRIELPGKDPSFGMESNSLGKEEASDEVLFLSEKELYDFDSDRESFSFGDRFSVMSNVIDSNSDEFWSEKDFDGRFESETLMEFDEGKIESMDDIQNSEEIHLNNTRILDLVYINANDGSSPVLQNSEEPHLLDSNTSEREVPAEGEFCEKKAEPKREDLGGEGAELMDGSEKSEKPNLQYSSSLDSDDSNGLETLWEHQDLIEQLKMELKKVRATGLPTILEESESPKMTEDLKPWKIDEKFLHEDQMDELHKFYKTYRERMRKFDILNYQKMYAMGFLQLKEDPLQSISIQKSSTPTFASIISQNFRLSKRTRPEADSSVKFIRELQNDLEMVYVGQVCLSWEFLHWQYGKARELLRSDPYEIRQYNQVAGEFQQFQVLMHRFIENEPFQGPRVQSYIKNRCVLRNLLQVPVIKEDPKEKEGRKRRKDAITCSMLLEIIEELIRIFWTFLRADKEEGNLISKGLLGPQVELQDPADSMLLMEVQTNLQKKEKKLKEILRSGNCIVKRFKKHHKEQSDQLLFFSQIDLKLVSRVLNMSRLTTDQITWCSKKLNKITFVDRKIHMETSFLLFPC